MTSSLDFFNQLSGSLDIKLSEPTEAIAPNLANQKANPTATIESISLTLTVYLEDKEDFRDLTEEELDQVAIACPSIRLSSEEGEPVSHDAPNGESFRIRDLIDAIVETERKTRGGTEWFGGIDVHHVFFEGLDESGEGEWEICWGS